MIEQLIVSFVASAAFGILFNSPPKLMLQCGFVGMAGWFVYILCTDNNIGPIPASLTASFVIAMMSHLFAKLYRTPIIVFNVAGVIPLVPGGIAYDAMRNIVEDQYDQAIQLAFKASMISGAIAIGIIFSEVLHQVMRRRVKG
ncbi:threonine/serine exporter family protein [Paenibacillus popilliae]|uniref:Threonine/serine exporter n=1 Tax=Paenibacillus popilliae TaxID=78057 RepID=A0ABY3AMV6_PAEPP|nr:threonine/serine exporter family protein [Paenibacillus sp. SDF0028]TQR43936.1 threonine/serine exporter [Paenibacillus sp. SDF0028]